MDIVDIQPFVRFSNRVTFKKTPISFKSYDCRLFYVLKGKGAIIMDNIKYELEYGTLMVHQPNVKYQFWWDNDEELVIISINFDMTWNHNNRNKLMMPGRLEIYNVEDITEIVSISPFDKPVYLTNMQALENDLFEIHKENSERKLYYEARNSALFKGVLLKIARTLAIGYISSSRIVQSLINYVHTNYMNDINNKSIAKAFNYHQCYLNKLMKVGTGATMHKYIMESRINAAVKLITETALPVSEISRQCGFKSQAHFSVYFKKITGRTPCSFR